MKIRLKSRKSEWSETVSSDEYNVIFVYSSDVRDPRAVILGYNDYSKISLASLNEVDVTNAESGLNWKVRFLSQDDFEFPNFVLRIGTETSLKDSCLYKLIEGSREEKR